MSKPLTNSYHDSHFKSRAKEAPKKSKLFAECHGGSVSFPQSVFMGPGTMGTTPCSHRAISRRRGQKEEAYLTIQRNSQDNLIPEERGRGRVYFKVENEIDQ